MNVRNSKIEFKTNNKVHKKQILFCKSAKQKATKLKASQKITPNWLINLITTTKAKSKNKNRHKKSHVKLTKII